VLQAGGAAAAGEGGEIVEGGSEVAAASFLPCF